MSTRAAANIQDEMEALGPVRLTEVQEAQKQIPYIFPTFCKQSEVREV